MDFSLSDDQRMLAELVGRFVDKDYAFEARKASATAPDGFSRRQWERMAQTGLLGVCVPQDFGGLGGTAADVQVVMDAFGRGLVVEPYVENAVVAARLLASAGNPEQQSLHLGSLVSGNTLFALACLEPSGGFDLWQVETSARRVGDGWVLDGAKGSVHFGASADVLIVSARTSGAIEDQSGISLFLVDRNAPGVQVENFSTFDSRRVAEVRLQQVKVPLDAVLGTLDEGFPLLSHAIDHGIAALCAEAAGAMQKLLELTTEYLRTRKQFGKAIGSFQALQHRAADMVIAIEQARSAAFMAAALAAEEDPAKRRRSISAAKALVGRSGRQVGEAATQLHGGMGMTDEMPSGHYFKRLLAIDKTWGDSDHHTELFSELLE